MLKKLGRIFFLIFILTSCSYFQPIKVRKPKLPSKFTQFSFKTKKTFCRKWWKELKDPFLWNLIEVGIKNNQNVKILKFKIKELMALARIEKSKWLPTINLKGTGEKVHYESRSPFMRYIPQETYTLGIAASYEIDLWQKIKNSYKSAIYRIFSAEWEKRALELSISAQIATSYYKLRYLKAKMTLVEKEIKIHKKLLKLLKLRFDKGIIPLSKVKKEKLVFLQRKEVLENLKKQIQAVKASLSILLGKYKLDFPIEAGLPQKLPLLPEYIPSSLLKRRPDIKEVEYEIKSANSEYLSFLAKRFPNINLTIFAGTQSLELKDVFLKENFFWKLAFETSLTIFDYGRLKAQSEAQKWKVKELAEKYARTVLNAFWEVRKGITNEFYLKNIINYKYKELKEAESLLKFTQERFKKGLTSLEDLLNAQLQFLDLKGTLLDAQYAFIENRIFIYRSLGGGTTICQKN